MAKYNWKKNKLSNDGVQILHWGRRTGKTTKCIEFLENNPRARVIIPYRSMRSAYPRLLQERLIVAPSLEISSLNYDTPLAIDEAETFKSSVLLDIYNRKKDQIKLITTTETNSALDYIIKRNRRNYSTKHNKEVELQFRGHSADNIFIDEWEQITQPEWTAVFQGSWSGRLEPEDIIQPMWTRVRSN